MSIKTENAALEVYFVDDILRAMMKHASIRFLCILGIQYIRGSTFYPNFHLITHRNSSGFAVKFISMFSNTYFLQYPLNIIPFTFKSNIVGCFIKRNWKKRNSGCCKTTFKLNLLHNRIGCK